MNPTMTRAEALAIVQSDAVVCDALPVATLAEMSLWAFYEAVKRGDAPVTPIKIGRRQKYRTSDVRALFGIELASGLGA